MNDCISTQALNGDFIAHYRTKGSKNGQRLYQYEDGTYTELGKARRRVDKPKLTKEERAERTKRWFAPTVKTGKDKPNISPAEKVIKESSNIVDETRKINRTVNKLKKHENAAKKMSDEELTRRIKRLELERRYNDLNEEDVSRGRITFDDVLSTVGSVSLIALSAASIYSTLKNT